VVGLQEVWAREKKNLTGWLGERLVTRWTWAASRAPGGWWKRIGESTADIGDAVLSRWPVEDRPVLHLPTVEGQDDERLALNALLDAPRTLYPASHNVSAAVVTAARMVA
jgi:endonuclease/exonuclease/phosphatase family metal-dependent hydrolase